MKSKNQNNQMLECYNYREEEKFNYNSQDYFRDKYQNN